MPSPLLPPIGVDLSEWGRQLTSYLQRNLAKLGFKTSDDNPSENGVILWDDASGFPVVSYNNEFRQIVMRGGHASFIRSTDVTAASANTAYSITYDAPSNFSRINRDGSNPERIVFDEAGEYVISFSAEIASTSSSTVTFYFWPAINGVNVAGATMVNSLHQNNATLVVSRTAIFDLNADDYLEVKWAVTDTNGHLNTTAATSFSPSSPATTLSITRNHE